MRILLVEDEEILGKQIVSRLKSEGFLVEWADRGIEGSYLLEEEKFDLAILDLQLPELDGLAILQRARSRGIRTPVLILTTRNLVKNRVEGLETGADDYLGKPFEYRELLARVRALIRRTQSSAQSILQEGDLVMDLNRRSVSRAEKEITLSTREYNLLEALLLQKGKVLTRQELLEKIYDLHFDCDSNVLDVYISYLRRKVDRPFAKTLIHTVRGTGYILESRG
jgi:two-component system, OmpR family, copper resistance phosphate regulon response regulator CusR